MLFFFFKQKTAYEMRISDWSSDVCSSDLHVTVRYFEGGKGEPLVFLHGAGGVTAEDPFLAKLAEKYHVYAPLLPGYGDSQECGELREMLDITDRKSVE